MPLGKSSWMVRSGEGLSEKMTLNEKPDGHRVTKTVYWVSREDGGTGRNQRPWKNCEAGSPG